MAKLEWTVPNAADGQRIDACLRRFLPQLKAEGLMEAFRRRDVKLDGVRVSQDRRVSTGQKVEVYCMEDRILSDPLEVIYEDQDVLLVDKPAGISVEKDNGNGLTLTDLCLSHVRASDASAPAPMACHRLDNRTCGLCLFAKNDRALEILTEVFRNRTLDKRYLCIVRGQMKPPSASCKAWLVKDAKAGKVRVEDHPVPDGKPIRTDYETLETRKTCSLLRVHLVTGRTHQIRAHLAALGHPLLGDDVYGDYDFNRREHTRSLRLKAVSLTLDTGGRLPALDGRTFTVKDPDHF